MSVLNEKYLRHYETLRLHSDILLDYNFDKHIYYNIIPAIVETTCTNAGNYKYL